MGDRLGQVLAFLSRAVILSRVTRPMRKESVMGRTNDRHEQNHKSASSSKAFYVFSLVVAPLLGLFLLLVGLWISSKAHHLGLPVWGEGVLLILWSVAVTCVLLYRRLTAEHDGARGAEAFADDATRAASGGSQGNVGQDLKPGLQEVPARGEKGMSTIGPRYKHGNEKEVWLAAILALFFGPIGMIYVSARLALYDLLVIMGLSLLAAVINPALQGHRGLFMLWGLALLLYLAVGQPWWAALWARGHNERVRNQVKTDTRAPKCD
jgi:hypothetical protein